MKLFDFTKDTNPTGISKKAKNAMRKSIKKVDSYNDDRHIRFKRYLCKIFDIAEENIFIGQDAGHIISGLIRLIRPEKIYIAAPVSTRYISLLQDSHPQIEPLEIDEIVGYGNIIDKLDKKINKSDIILISTPHNLTGKLILKENIEELLIEADRRKKTIIIDESYIEFTDSHSSAQQVIKTDYAITVRTFSTFYAMPGMPLGYAIGSKGLIEGLKEMFFSHLPMLNVFACDAAIASMKDKGYRKRTLDFIKDEKTYITKKLAGVRDIQVIDTPCNFVLLKIEGDESILQANMLKKGIIIDTFRQSGGIYLRLPVRKHKENAFFIKNLKHSMDATGG